MTKSIVISHIIQELSRGGGARATIYLSHYSQKFWNSEHGNIRHQIVSIKKADPQAIQIASEYEIGVIDAPSEAELDNIIAHSDIVQVSWWNNTDLYKLFMKGIPAARLVGWFHVGGQAAPQVITNKLVDYFDLSIACSPFTYSHPAFQSLHPEERDQRCAMVYGATDLNRVSTVEPRQHDGFNIGYIGTVDFIKMHPDYVKMSAQSGISAAQFLLCGSGEAIPQIMSEASNLGVTENFKYLGYVEDIASFLSILDVYGYPLREDTYAASEMNLQEVMYAGVPCVVLPSGGIKDLVIHNHTGLVCSSTQEYSEALRYLYENSSERIRLGQNAREYASKIFGAENAGKKINDYYLKLLLNPKYERIWGDKTYRKDLTDRFIPYEASRENHTLFIESLGNYAGAFLISSQSKYINEQLKADRVISNSGDVLLKSGISAYKNEYPKDWLLNYWQGLVFLKNKQYQYAMQSLVDSVNNGADVRAIAALKRTASLAGLIEIETQIDDVLLNMINVPINTLENFFNTL